MPFTVGNLRYPDDNLYSGKRAQIKVISEGGVDVFQWVHQLSDSVDNIQVRVLEVDPDSADAGVVTRNIPFGTQDVHLVGIDALGLATDDTLVEIRNKFAASGTVVTNLDLSATENALEVAIAEVRDRLPVGGTASQTTLETLATQATLAALNAKFSALGVNTSVNSVPVVLANDAVVNVRPAAPVATSYLPVRLTDGEFYVEHQPTYYLYQTPIVTAGAARDMFDLFNAAGSGKIIKIEAIFPVIEITAASAIVPTFRFSVIKTNSIGTGGGALVVGGAAAPAAGVLNLSQPDSQDAALPAQITARSIPTGGAAAQRFLFDMFFTNEETNAAPYLVQGINFVPSNNPELKAITLREGEGLKIRQITATASTGTNYGWFIVFRLT